MKHPYRFQSSLMEEIRKKYGLFSSTVGGDTPEEWIAIKQEGEDVFALSAWRPLLVESVAVAPVVLGHV